MAENLSNMYPGYRRRAPEPEKPANTRLYLGLGVVVLLLGAVGGGLLIHRATGGEEGGKPKLGEDAKVEAMIRDEAGKEMRQWLDESPHRLVSGMTLPQAKGFVEKLYGMGAVKVYAFGTSTMSVAIELPQDPAKRAELFRWQAQWHSEMMEKTHTDVGQKYLLIRLRI